MQSLGPAADLGCDGRRHGGNLAFEPLAGAILVAAAGQAFVGEELDGPQRDQAALDEKPPEHGSLPGRLAEILPTGQHGDQGALGTALGRCASAAWFTVTSEGFQQLLVGVVGRSVIPSWVHPGGSTRRE